MCTFTSTVSKASHSLEIRTSRLSKNLNRPTHGAAKYMTTKRAFPSFPKGFPLHVSYSTNLHGHRMAQDPSWKPLKEPRTLLFEGVLAGKTTRLTAPRKKVRNKSDHSNWSCKTKPFNFCKTPIFFPGLDRHSWRVGTWIPKFRKSTLLAIGWLRCWKEQLVNKGWPHRCNQEFTFIPFNKTFGSVGIQTIYIPVQIPPIYKMLLKWRSWCLFAWEMPELPRILPLHAPTELAGGATGGTISNIFYLHSYSVSMRKLNTSGHEDWHIWDSSSLSI